MDKCRFDVLSRSVGRRASLGMMAALALGVRSALAAPKCRIEGHPCEGNQDCCSGLECRVNSHDGAERCAVPGQPDPDPIDPVVPPPSGGGGNGGSGGGGATARRRNRKGKKDNRLGHQRRVHCHPGWTGECAPGFHCEGGQEPGAHPSCVRD